MKSVSSFSGRARSQRLRRSCRLYLETLETRDLLSVCTVDRLTDNNPAGGGEGGNGMGDLRYCIGHGDTVTFGDGVMGTINLAGPLPPLNSINIQGPGADFLTVRRNTVAIFRIFTISSDSTVSISGLTISNGVITGDSGGGGGILNNGGRLTVSNCTISGNTNLGAVGGGIRNVGTLIVNNSTISGNTALGGTGGGIANPGGTLTVSNTTIADNTAAVGGGIDSETTAGSGVTVSNSTIAGNFATSGGGIYTNNNTGSGVTVSNSIIAGNFAWGGGGIFNNAGGLMVSNSTISGNSADHGGGIASAGQLTVSNSTIAGNSSWNQGGGIFANNSTLNVTDSTIAGNFAGSSGGGIYVVAPGTMAARNTIMAGNAAGAGPDVFGNLGSQGYNLVRNASGGSGFAGTDLLNVDPLLGPLQDNGGPTLTAALPPGSPALNAGDPTQLGSPDQRGIMRTGRVNIGAYQASASSFIVTAPRRVTAGTPFDVTVTAVDPFGRVAVGYTGTVTFSTTDPDPGVMLPADYSFTLTDGGSHTFAGETTLQSRGHQAITATDTADGSITGSAVVKVRHQRHHDGGSPGVSAGQDLAAADRVFAALLPEDFGWLPSASHHRNGETGSWDLDVFSQRERVA